MASSRQLPGANARSGCLTEGQLDFQMFGERRQQAAGVRRQLVAQHAEPEHTHTHAGENMTFSQQNNLHSAALKALMGSHSVLTGGDGGGGGPHILGVL